MLLPQEKEILKSNKFKAQYIKIFITHGYRQTRLGGEKLALHTWKRKSGVGFEDWPQLYSLSMASVGYIRSCLKNKTRLNRAK